MQKSSLLPLRSLVLVCRNARTRMKQDLHRVLARAVRANPQGSAIITTMATRKVTLPNSVHVKMHNNTNIPVILKHTYVREFSNYGNVACI